MKSGLLPRLATILILCVFPCTGVPGDAGSTAYASYVGYLLSVASHSNQPENGSRVPYQPRPGDLILYDNHRTLYHVVYSLAGTGPPTHVAVVIEGDDGRPALLELTGPSVMRAKVVVMGVRQRLESYDGSILVRRFRGALTPEQCRLMSDFAHEQEGKDFACRRIALQLTPFRARSGLRHYCFAHTYFHRRRWLCSEMVVAALSAAGVLDPTVYCANSIYPRDLAFDEQYDLSALYEPAVEWTR